MMEINNEDLNNKAIVVATCPVKNYNEYLVSATSIGNKSNEQFLCLYIFDIRSSKDPIKLLAKIPTNLVFSSIAWTSYGENSEDHALGYVIGGHPDGSISLWDMTAILQNSGESNQTENYGCAHTERLLNSRINVISINEKPHIFAIGSKNVSIISISQDLKLTPAVKCEPPVEGGEFCSLSWNEKVSHILASSTDTGMTYIYNMKTSKIFLSILDHNLFSDESNTNSQIRTNVIWNNDGAQVILAYDDNDFNYLAQYHMKQPKAPSAMYQNGHSTSIIDITKNTIDNNFLLSLGRDNVCTCWSIKTKKPIAKINLKAKCSQVLWINKMPDCFITAGFDGNIYYDRINFTEDLSIYSEGNEVIPNWLSNTKNVNTHFAFGGKIYMYNLLNSNSSVNIYNVTGDKKLVEKIKNFLTKIENNDLNELIDEKINQNESNNNKNIASFWAALKSINSKKIDYLFTQMGISKEEIGNEISIALGKSKKHKNKNENVRELYTPQMEENEGDIFQLFEKSPIEQNTDTFEQNALTKQELLEKPNTINETISRNVNWNVGDEKLIKQSLLIGDLESAVELLFKCKRYSEALLIASCQPELFAKAKDLYFDENKDLFVKSIFPSIINNNFDKLFDYNIAKEWKEYLLFAKTYLGDSDEFINFAIRLGDKLSTNLDIYAALICYILANEYNKSIDLLVNNYFKEYDKINKEEKKIVLQSLFEEIICINKILNYNNKFINENYNKIIYDYSLLLIEEGLHLEASKYLINIKNDDKKILELFDRLYNYCEPELCKFCNKPNSPFNIITIRPKLNYYQQQQQQNQYRKAKGPNNMMGYNNNMTNERKYSNPGNSPFDNNQNNKPLQHNMPPLKRNAPMPMSNQQPPQRKIENNNSNPFSQSHAPHPPTFNQSSNIRNNQNNSDLNAMNSPYDNNQQPQLNSEKKTNINFGANRKGFNQISKPPTFKPVNPPMMKQQNMPMQPMQSNIQPPMQKPNMPTQNMNQFSPPQFRKNEPQKPFSSKPMNDASSFNNVNQLNKQQEQIKNAQPSQPMSQDEQQIYDYFNKFTDVYNNTYHDENKRKDFSSKVNVLFSKLENHEFKPYLIKLILDFIDLNEKGQVQNLKKLYMRIQSCDWDKNKSWMPLLERIINMKR